jgi:hypothetical protein
MRKNGLERQRPRVPSRIGGNLLVDEKIGFNHQWRLLLKKLNLKWLRLKDP